jgi:hypothetical protein
MQYKLSVEMPEEEFFYWAVDYITRLQDYIAFGGLFNTLEIIKIKEEIDRVKLLISKTAYQ